MSINRLSLAIALLVLLPSMSHAQTLAVAGERMPEFRFRKVVMNGDGHVSRNHFVGRPVLIEMWGYR